MKSAVLSWPAPCALAAACLIVASAQARSIDDDSELLLAYGDKASVSLATGTRQPLRRAPAVATVITAEDIAAMGATTLDQVLETVPGLHVNLAASMGNTLYVMRGVFSLNTPQVLMLQNGIPITVALSGGRGNLSGGPAVENVARIEVLRGPGSALFGADAFSGVINIVTKGAADASGTRLGLRGGSFGSAAAWLQHGGTLGPLALAAFVKVARTDGFERRIEADAQSRNDRGFGTQASLAPGPVNTQERGVDGSLELATGDWRWRTLYKLRDDLGTYAGLGSALDPLGRGRSERLVTDLSWQQARLGPAWRDWGASVNLSWMHYAQRFPVPAQIFPPGARLPTGTFADGMRGAPEFAERSLRLSATLAYGGWQGHAWRFGLGHDDLDMYRTREVKNFGYTATGVPVPAGPLVESPLPFIYPQRRRVDYLFVQDEWQFRPDWALTAGLRHDRYSDAGSTTNPRAALVWDLGVDLTAKLLYGQAFRAPAFAELYSTNNPIARGNPALAPEKTRTLETVLLWTPGSDLQLSLNLFRYRMVQIIRSVPNPAPTPGSTYTNTGRQHGRGAEFEATWDAMAALRLTGHLSLQRAIDPATGLDVGNVPRRDIFLRGDWRLGAGWQANLQLNHVAGRRRAPGDTRPPVPDYTTVDLALRYEPQAGGWTFDAALRNAFDADAREPGLAPGLVPFDLPLAGRDITLQLARSF